MMEFKEGKITEKNLTTLTAYVSETELLFHGKRIAQEVIHALVKQLILIHTDDLHKIVNELIVSPDTRKYIENKIREVIDKEIQLEIEDMFRRDK